jgi:hypothetical protein
MAERRDTTPVCARLCSCHAADYAAANRGVGQVFLRRVLDRWIHNEDRSPHGDSPEESSMRGGSITYQM